MALALILVPLALAAVAFAVPSERWRPWLVPVGRRRPPRADVVLALAPPAVAALDGWLRARPARPAGPRVPEPALLPLLVLRARLPARCAPERSNRVFCACLLAFLGDDDARSIVSHHLGLMWVAIEADHARVRAAALLQPQPALARGDLEVPAHRLGRHRAGAARLVLPRLLGAPRRARASSLLFDDLVREAPQLSPPVAARRLRAAVRRLRHEDGPRADAHLEARRLRRGARARRRAARRRPHELRVPRAPPLLPDLRRRRRGRVRARAAARASGLLSMAVAGVFMARQRDFKRMLAYSSVEHMGILVLGIGHRRRRRRSARCSTWSTTASPRACCSSPPATSTAPTAASSPTTCRGALRRVPVSGALLPRRLLRDHRLAAVRALPQRVHHPAAPRSRAGSSSSAALFLALLVRRLHRHGRDGAVGRPGRAAAGDAADAAYREQLADGRAAARVPRARARCSASTSRRRSTRARCSDAAAASWRPADDATPLRRSHNGSRGAARRRCRGSPLDAFRALVDRRAARAAAASRRCSGSPRGRRRSSSFAVLAADDDGHARARRTPSSRATRSRR